MPDLHRTSGGQALDGEGLFGSLLGGCTHVDQAALKG
jgi:hypothetical protein